MKHYHTATPWGTVANFTDWCVKHAIEELNQLPPNQNVMVLSAVFMTSWIAPSLVYELVAPSRTNRGSLLNGTIIGRDWNRLAIGVTGWWIYYRRTQGRKKEAQLSRIAEEKEEW